MMREYDKCSHVEYPKCTRQNERLLFKMKGIYLNVHFGYSSFFTVFLLVVNFVDRTIKR